MKRILDAHPEWLEVSKQWYENTCKRHETDFARTKDAGFSKLSQAEQMAWQSVMLAKT